MLVDVWESLRSEQRFIYPQPAVTGGGLDDADVVSQVLSGQAVSVVLFHVIVGATCVPVHGYTSGQRCCGRTYVVFGMTPAVVMWARELVHYAGALQGVRVGRHVVFHEETACFSVLVVDDQIDASLIIGRNDVVVYYALQNALVDFM